MTSIILNFTVKQSYSSTTLDFGFSGIAPSKVFPVGIAKSHEFGAAHLELSLKPVVVKGTDYLRFGVTRVRDSTDTRTILSFESELTTPSSTLSFGEQGVVYPSYLLPKPIAPPDITLDSISNHIRLVELTGIPSERHGLALIKNNAVLVQPKGFALTGYGSAQVDKPPQLWPGGIDGLRFSEPLVENKDRYLSISGNAYSLYGNEAKVILRTRWTHPSGWGSEALSNSAMASYFLRWVEVSGADSRVCGTPWISHSPRSLLPSSIFTDNPSDHRVSRNIVIEPHGYEATLWGTRIIPESMTLYPQGFIGSFGTAFAQLYTRYIQPRSFLSVGVQPADRWGWHLAYNLTQYINQYLVPDGGLVPPKWPEWQSIENRNKIIGVIGFNSMRHGYTNMENNARLLEVKGSDFNQYGSSMTSYRIRTVSTAPIEHPVMTAWGVVYNAARLISASGLHAGTYGAHKAANTRRYYERVGNFESLAMGLPMVSDRIRAISIEPRYSIAPPIIRLPTIDLLTKYVSFNGYETAGYGSPSLSIHFNIIAPKWMHSEKSGSPALNNLTPELHIRGHDSSEFGMSSIRTQWRTIEAQGDGATLFGLNRVSDTKQSVLISGWQDMSASQNHKVVKLGTNAYVLQYVFLNNESGYGPSYGIPEPYRQVSTPGLNQNVLYPSSINLFAMGIAFLRTNNLVIESGIAIQNISNNTHVYNKRIYVNNVGGIASSIAAGKPRLSPHTIWAVVEAPVQAQANHERVNLHYVGSTDGGPGARLGRPSVESTIRRIYAWDFPESRENKLGVPRADLKRKVVKPESFRLSRFGVPSIPFTLQDIALRSAIDQLVFGLTDVKRPPYVGPLHINAAGINSMAVGLHRADNFIRHLQANGIDSQSMGYSRWGDTPYMWQSLRVGEHVPLVAGGSDLLMFGNQKVWHKVRELQAIGFNAFSSGYELSNFRGRMTVSNATLPEGMLFEITVPGREGSEIGQHGVKLGHHFIRPDGNSEQFRKGAW